MNARAIRIILLSVVGLGLMTWLTQPVSQKTPKDILEIAFKTIGSKDWATFTKFVLTDADILEKGKAEEGLDVKIFQEMRQKFERALTLGDIDFSKATFLDAGTRLDGDVTNGITTEIYSLRIKVNSKVVDTKSLSPVFKVILWEGKWYIKDLIFS